MTPRPQLSTENRPKQLDKNLIHSVIKLAAYFETFFIANRNFYSTLKCNQQQQSDSGDDDTEVFTLLRQLEERFNILQNHHKTLQGHIDYHRRHEALNAEASGEDNEKLKRLKQKMLRLKINVCDYSDEFIQWHSTLL